MMLNKKIINGKKYRFVIYFLNQYNKESYFYIEAINKKKLTHSYINNVNCILSEFDIGIDDPKIAESQWYVKRKEAMNFFNKATDFLTNKDFLNYVEKQLDLDRELGEWNET